MRKSMLLCGVLAAACFVAVSVQAEDKKPEAPAATETSPAAVSPEAATEKKEAPEFLVFDKAKLGAVKFAHKAHADRAGCAACHEGKEPLFAQKLTGGMKMADMYAGKSCGACHNGKEMAVGKDKKVVFAAKGGCMKCHKKA